MQELPSFFPRLNERGKVTVLFDLEYKRRLAELLGIEVDQVETYSENKLSSEDFSALAKWARKSNPHPDYNPQGYQYWLETLQALENQAP